MKCPYQTVTITETVRGMAIGSSDYIRSEVGFKDCLHEECPAYYAKFVKNEWGDNEAVECCRRVKSDEKKNN